MKVIFYVLALFCVISCTTTNYHIQCKNVDNEIVLDTIYEAVERVFNKGGDVHAKICAEQVNCVDTFYMFYYVQINDFVWEKKFLDKKINKPIYISIFDYLEKEK